MSCIKCGLCLSSCPTFQQTGLERESPRGRVQLIASVAQGVMPLTQGPLADTMFSCLDCRACEVACPSGVPIGRLIEKGRAEVVHLSRRQAAQTPGEQATRLALQSLIPYPRRLRTLGRLVRWSQRTGLAHWSRHLKFLPEGLRGYAGSLRRLPSRTGREMLAADPSPVPAPGSPRVDLFLGCVMDVVFGEANLATKRVLERNGCAVSAPLGQVCCGALAVHAGDRDGARALARTNIDTFLQSDPAYIATNAGGCGAALLEYPEWFADDPVYRARAERFAERVRDASQIVETVGFRPPAGRFPHTVTYQASCHLHNVMKVGDTPQRLLQSIAGLIYRPMADMARCCGSAGIYNLTHPAMSAQLLARKMADIPPEADIVVTGNPGCWLQLEHGAATSGPPVRVMHVMEVLAEAYRSEPSAGQSES
ncbi:MAG: heterodisulfide reductase-related iron-sulfur binding cluster [Thermaerobacter sp.]|nr:heterodisulfide reductase-related iron-sulfur binding cluster [Thermaerobacter sp.]